MLDPPVVVLCKQGWQAGRCAALMIVKTGPVVLHETSGLAAGLVAGHLARFNRHGLFRISRLVNPRVSGSASH
jgi:hypothetical protein